MKSLLLLQLFILFTIQSGWTQEHSIPYTQADRDRLVRVETKVEGLNKRIIKALKEAAEKDPALREALKRTALW